MGEVECYRVGPAEFSGAEPMIEITPAEVAGLDPGESVDPLWRAESFEAQPILFAEEPELQPSPSSGGGQHRVIGAVSDADRVLDFDHGRVSVEPLGLNLHSSLPLRSELTLAERLVGRQARNRCRSPRTSGAPGTLDRAAVTGSHRSAAPPAIPDPVGDVPAKIPLLGAPVHRLSRCAWRSCDNEQAARRDRLLPVRRPQIESVDLERRRSRSQGHRLAPHPAGGQPTAVHAEPGRDR